MKKPLTEEQEQRVYALADMYHEINALTLDPDPLVQLIEKTIFERTKAKKELAAAQFAAKEAGAVHIDYLSKRCIELFTRFGVTVDWAGLILNLRIPKGNYTFAIYVSLDKKDTTVHSFNYTGMRGYYVKPVPESYNEILTAAAKWVADSVQI